MKMIVIIVLFVLAISASSSSLVLASNEEEIDREKEKVIRCIIEADGKDEMRICVENHRNGNSSLLSCPEGPATDLLYRDWCKPPSQEPRP